MKEFYEAREIYPDDDGRNWAIRILMEIRQTRAFIMVNR